MTQSNTEAKTLLALALLALQNNSKLSVRSAAGIYEVNEHRLRRRRKGIQSRRDWKHLLESRPCQGKDRHSEGLRSRLCDISGALIIRRGDYLEYMSTFLQLRLELLRKVSAA